MFEHWDNGTGFSNSLNPVNKYELAKQKKLGDQRRLSVDGSACDRNHT